MNLSKVYQNTPSFVPEQILPRQEHSPEQVWQETTAVSSAQHNHQESFVPDKTDGHPIIAAKQPSLSQQQTATANNLSPEQVAKSEEKKAEAPAIDLEQVRQKAYAEGVIEGRRLVDEYFGTCAKSMLQASKQLDHLHETILQNNTRKMHLLVMDIAEKIIRHSLQKQSDTILATIEEAIRLAVKSEEFEIRVNPEDLEVIKQKKKELIDEISGLNNIVLKADRAIERGGCLLESVNCTVDATITSQLQMIDEALQSADLDTDTTFPGEP